MQTNLLQNRSALLCFLKTCHADLNVYVIQFNHLGISQDVEQAHQDWIAQSPRFGSISDPTAGKRLNAPSLAGLQLKSGSH